MKENCSWLSLRYFGISLLESTRSYVSLSRSNRSKPFRTRRTISDGSRKRSSLYSVCEKEAILFAISATVLKQLLQCQDEFSKSRSDQPMRSSSGLTVSSPL